MKEVKSMFASSVDPTEVSLTVSSAGKIIVSLLVMFLARKGFDPMVAKSGLEQIVDILVGLVPAVVALYHGYQMCVGLLRKIYYTK